MDMDHHHHQQQQESSISCAVPPGFRFHPTEEELVGYYLARKVAASSTSPHKQVDLDIIQEVDLYRIEPWDLQERCCSKHGGGNADDQIQTHQTEWYFFSYKDRKYPSGTRTNRATAAGFWKATGRDKPVLSSRSSSRVIGMRKTLVFYRGRAPNGRKTDWIMHEYRLQSNEHAPAQEEGWVVCRAFQKPIPNQQQRPFFPSYAYPTPAAGGYYDYDHHLLGSSALPHPAGAAAGGGGGPAAAASVSVTAAGNMISGFPPQSSSLYSAALADDDLLESKKHLCFSSISILPQLESPTAVACCDDGYAAQRQSSYDIAHDDELMILQQQQQVGQQAAGAAIDWSFLDTLLSATSQLHAEYPSTS